MKTKTIYIAEDGKNFNTEAECLAYEEMTNRKMLTYVDYDKYNHMSLLQAKNNGTYYIKIDTGDFHEGGTFFYGTFKEFVKKYFNKITG